MSDPSKKRFLFCFFAVIAIAGGLDALSCWWQFGYVFSRSGIGLRKEQFYYFYRENSVVPSIGFYVDDADKTNIVIGSSGGPNSHWDQVGVRPWLLSLSITGAVGIWLAKLAAKTRGRRRRKLRVALAIFTLADGVFWLISENVRWVYLEGRVYVLLTDGCVEGAIARHSAHFDFMRRSPEVWLSFANSIRIPRLGLSASVPNGRMPLWLPFFIALLPLLAVLFPPPRTEHERCGECDYDLTGNLSGVCPECGTAIVCPKSEKIETPTCDRAPDAPRA